MEDIAVGLKQMFLQAGMWQLSTLSVPVSLPAPVQSPEDLNSKLLQLFFGPDMAGMPPLPRGVELFVKDENMTCKVWARVKGAPPNQDASFFFDVSPFQTWYLQGRAQWAYAMKKSSDGIKLSWVRRVDYGTYAEGSEFEVMQVLPADAPGLQSIAGYHYVEGIYVTEGGVQKALYLELQKPVDYARGDRGKPAKIQLFACKEVPPTLQTALVNRGAVGQNFAPRRGTAGFVVRGRVPFDVDPTGYVWQEAYGGAVSFYYQDGFGNVTEFKQLTKEAPVLRREGPDNWAAVRAGNGQWQHEDVKDWAPTVLGQCAQNVQEEY